MAGRLKDKVAIITGGGDGFGAGIVDKFVAEGAKVVIVDINEATAQKKASSFPVGHAIAFRGDVSTEVCWAEALKTAISQFGSLDVVVNNAGIIHQSKPSIEVSEKEFGLLFDVNVKQLYWSTKIVIPYFKETSKPGLFINISSISASRPRPNLVWYAASKGAVSTATRGLAIEWAKDNIRFNAICPAAGETSMVPSEARSGMLSTIPLGRLGTSADIGNAACYLASDEATYITGLCMDVDGGRGI